MGGPRSRPHIAVQRLLADAALSTAPYHANPPCAHCCSAASRGTGPAQLRSDGPPRRRAAPTLSGMSERTTACQSSGSTSRIT